MTKKHVEELVFEGLFKSFDRKHEASTTSVQEAAEIAEKREALKASEVELMQYFARGELTMIDVVVAKKDLQKQLEAFPLPATKVKVRPQLTGDEIRELWPDLELKERRTLIQQAFERIIVHTSTITKGASTLTSAGLR